MSYVDLVTFDANDVYISNSEVVDNDTVLIVYLDNVSGTLKTKLIDSDGTSHAADEMSPDTNYSIQYTPITLLKLTSSLFVAAWAEIRALVDIKGRIAPIAVSGNSATFGAASQFDIGAQLNYGPVGFSLGYISANSAALFYIFQSTALSPIQAKARVISDIIASGLTVNASNTIATGISNTNPSYKKLSICKSATNRLHCQYHNGSNSIIIGLLDVSGTTISLVDSDTIIQSTNFTITSSLQSLVNIDTQKSVLVYHEFDALPSPLYDYYALVVTDDGVNIALNAANEYRNNTSLSTDPIAKMLNNGTVAVWHGNSTDNMITDILSVSGTTVAVSLGTAQSDLGVEGGYDNSRSLVAIASTFGGIRSGSGIFFTFAPQAELRYLDLAFDSQKVYATLNDTGTLKLFSYAQDLTPSEIKSFGDVSYADLDNYTNGLNIRCFPNLANTLWLYGRDGNGIQLQYSDDNGATFTDLSDAAWGSECVTSCFISLFNQQDILLTLHNNDVYNTLDGGVIWTKKGDGLGVDIITAERHPIFDKSMIAASSANGDLSITPNLGVDFTDISIPAGSKINVIKKAF